jgi:hypothetical protein
MTNEDKKKGRLLIKKLERMTDRLTKMLILSLKNTHPHIDASKVTNGKMISEFRALEAALREHKRELKISFKKKHAIFDLLFQLHLLEHYDLLFLLSDGTDLKPAHFSHLPENSTSRKRLFLFLCLLVNLTNTMHCIREMLYSGMGLQAKILLRSYIEYADVAMVSLSSEEFYRKFTEQTDDFKQATRVWHDTTKPKKIERELNKYCGDLNECGIEWESISAVRKSVYEYLSLFAHTTNVANFLSATGPASDPKFVRFSIAGVISDGMESTLFDSVIYANAFLVFSTAAIVKYHDLPFARFGDDGVSFTFRLKAADDVLRLFLKNELERRTKPKREL